MIPARKSADETKTQRDLGLLASRTAMTVAVVSALAEIFSLLLNYLLTERIRTEMLSQTLALERIKVEVSAAAQKTADVTSKIDAARLDLEKKIAVSTERLEVRKVNIEDKKSRTDEVRLTQDFAKLSNDLRPNVEVTCDGHYVRPDFFKLECKFKNNGAHRVKLVPQTFSLLDRTNQKIIDGAIHRIDNADPNSLLSGGAGSNTYDIYLGQRGERAKQPIVQGKLFARTDQQAIDMTRRLAGDISPKSSLRNYRSRSTRTTCVSTSDDT